MVYLLAALKHTMSFFPGCFLALFLSVTEAGDQADPAQRL